MAIPFEKVVKQDLNIGYGTLSVSMPGGGSATGDKIGLHTFADVYHVGVFGLVNDGVTDNTPAFNTMVATLAAFATHTPTVLFGPGVYRFASRPAAIPTGLVLTGNGSVGSTSGYGTRLLADYAEATPANGFFTWDGSLAAGAGGTGGGIRDAQVYRSANFSGGTALKFTGTDDNHRAGFNHVENVLIATQGSSTWNKGIYVDGTGLYTAGTKGVRTLYVSATDVTSCLDVDSNIYLFNAVHVHVVQGHFYPGTSANCGITVSGNASGPSTNVFFASCNIDGNVTLDYADAFFWQGRIGGNFSVTANTNNWGVHGEVAGTKTVNASSSGNLYLSDGLWMGGPIYPIFNVTNPTLSGIFTQPLTQVGADLIRARALSGATGTPDGWSVTGTSSQPYRGYNQNQNVADNNAVYYRAGYPAFRTGNPLGNGTYPYWIYVAPAGVAAGDPITYLAALKVKGSDGVIEFPVGIDVGSAGARPFSVLMNTSVIDPGIIADGAIATSNLTVAGAVLGDTAIMSFTTATAAGWVLTAHVTDNAGNVKCEFLNKSGGPIDLASGTLRVVVFHNL